MELLQQQRQLGMLYQDVFGAVYALTPAILGWAGDFNINNPAFKSMDLFKDQHTQEDIMHDVIGKADFSKFWIRSMATFARAYYLTKRGKHF